MPSAESLTADQLTQVEAELDRVIDQAAEVRQQRLAERLGDRPELLAMALRWSAALDAPHSPLDARPDAVATDNFSLQPGDQVQEWTIEAQLAQGGSSEVYRALRHKAGFEQRGALKLLRHAGMKRQFERERQLLTRLQHPHIARFLDGGVTAAGQAWTVLEFIDGPSLEDHCRQSRPSLGTRLSLFLKLCAAVSYAHNRLVVHRDIKPGNVRMTPAGEPMLLDFGIGRLLEEEGDQDATQTVFTPSYAAPEQLDRAPVSLATDIYGLGALLHFLLTQRAPWGLEQASLPVAIERILGEDRPAPAMLAETADAPFSPRLLRGDLTAIVQKAMARRPEGRYASVDALAADIRALLDHRPVAARGPSLRYQFHRFLRRNLWQSVAAAAVLAALLGGLLTTQHQAEQIAAERDAALRSAERAHAVRSSLFQLLRVFESAPQSFDRSELFEQAIADIRRLYADSPAAAGELLAGFGQLYFLGNDYARAEPLLREALALAARGSSAAAALVEARLDLAQVLFRTGERDEAAALLQQAQARMLEQPGRFRQDLIESRSLEAQLLRADGKPDAALRVLENAFASLAAYAGEDNTLAGVLATNLATAYVHAGRLDEALERFAYGWQVWQASGQTETPDALNLLNNWGAAALRAGDLDVAYQRLAQAHDLRVELFGDSAALSALKKNYAVVLWHHGERDQAMQMFRDAERMAAEFVGLRSPLHLGIGSFLAEYLLYEGQLEEAREVLARCWDGATGPLPFRARAQALRFELDGDDAITRAALAELDSILAARGAAMATVRAFVLERRAAALATQPRAALPHQRQAVLLRTKYQGPSHWDTLAAEVALLKLERRLGDESGRADQLLSRARDRYGPDSPILNDLRRQLAD